MQCDIFSHCWCELALKPVKKKIGLHQHSAVVESVIKQQGEKNFLSTCPWNYVMAVACDSRNSLDRSENRLENILVY